MTVTMNNPVCLSVSHGGHNTYKLSWSSNLSTPTYDLYDLTGGGLLYHGTLTTFNVMVNAGESPLYWVTDSSADPPASYPGRLKLQWYPVSGTAYYRVDEYVSAAWTEVSRQKHDLNAIYTFKTRFLEDVTTHTFRIIGIGVDGNESTAVELIAFLIRYPDVPDVSFTYSAATGKVTIGVN